MGSIKETKIKNQTYYIFDDMISIKNFNPSLIKIDKKSYKKALAFTILNLSL